MLNSANDVGTRNVIRDAIVTAMWGVWLECQVPFPEEATIKPKFAAGVVVGAITAID